MTNPQTYAVHSLHAPPVRLRDGGYSHDGRHVIAVGEPLHTADTEDEAEAWRLGMLEARK